MFFFNCSVFKDPYLFFDFFFSKVIVLYYTISFLICQALFYFIFLILCSPFCDFLAVTSNYYTLFSFFVKCFFYIFLFPLHTQSKNSSLLFFQGISRFLSDRNVVYHITAFFFLQAFFSFFLKFFYLSSFSLILCYFSLLYLLYFPKIKKSYLKILFFFYNIFFKK